MKSFVLVCSQLKLRGWRKLPEYSIKEAVGIRLPSVFFSPNAIIVPDRLFETQRYTLWQTQIYGILRTIPHTFSFLLDI